MSVASGSRALWPLGLGLALALSAPASAASERKREEKKGAPVIESAEPVVSRAEGGGVSGWSLLARTVGAGQNVLRAEVGWPGLALELTHGAAERVDVGLRLAVNDGFEGYPRLVGAPGVKLQAPVRFQLFDMGKLSLGLSLAPGFLLYAFPNNTMFGVTVPVGASFSLALTEAVNLGFGLDVPLFVTFGRFSSLTVPLLFGLGAEFFIDRGLALTLNVKLGPAINTRTGSGELSMSALAGVAFKL